MSQISQTTGTVRIPFRVGLSQLDGAQKPGDGVPAYMRWVNRRLARYLAAAFAAVGATPTLVSFISIGVTFLGLGAFIGQRSDPAAAGVVAAVLLALGFALDSADGQLARLQGSSSLQGEWLDHTLDAVRIPAVHVTVATGAVLTGLWPLAAVAGVYAVIASATFLGQNLASLMRDRSGSESMRALPLQSWLLLPSDTGVLCWVFVLWFNQTAFAVGYGALFAFNTFRSLLSARRRWRELGAAAEVEPAEAELARAGLAGAEPAGAESSAAELAEADLTRIELAAAELAEIDEYPITSPSVSVVIATRGRGNLLRRAVRSIAEQEYAGRIELVVVYDQSEIDPLSDLAAAFRPGVELKTIANSHSPGLAGGRNTGIAAATGELLALCDDDDEWTPYKLAAQVALWEENTAAAAIATGIKIATMDGAIVRMPPARTTRADLLRSRVGEIHPSTLLFRRATLLSLPGGVDESIPFSYGEDYDLLLRVAESGDIVSVTEPLAVIHWDRASYFAGRWEAMAAGLGFLLAKHPDLLRDRNNAARMCGQIAFAHAADGEYRKARRWANHSLHYRFVEPRGWLALITALGLVSPQTMISTLNAHGRGI